MFRMELSDPQGKLNVYRKSADGVVDGQSAKASEAL